jgi:hypothetical protein
MQGPENQPKFEYGIQYHPQMDGQSERANQRVEQYLRIYGNDEQNDWAELLPLAQYTHNATRNESTNTMPFELLIGCTPTVTILPFYSPLTPFFLHYMPSFTARIPIFIVLLRVTADH